MNFKNWVQANEMAEELNLYSKAELLRRNLKPTKDAKSEIHRVFTGGKWRSFEFYSIKDTVKIKRRNKAKIKREIEINNKVLCEALYIVNKSAKVSRDTKYKAYENRDFKTCNMSKTRSLNLYYLKDRVIEKMINEGKLQFIGYHKQNNVYLELYKNTETEFSFHKISNIKPENTLGNIDNMISSERKINVSISFNDAKEILKKYIS
ncbi:YkyB family protein [Clostridium thermobutyricum]|uniref:Uncharacterized protein n=1 Tax=Clostridium thermobutyricum DSM 4928 TaxID=1121339 RepID=A0A1V4SWA3_9CLOT|nr:YkyB family protein [Clostridium thermobutyricum]OPX47846.1 hypothetical protein CLTHE_14170 [Clostridium thermobutyricum DSM 4928]